MSLFSSSGINPFSLLNSNFFSAAFGAIAGALTATCLTHKGEKRRRLLDEIAACNVAIGQCVAIANLFIGLKRQRIVPMHSSYIAQRQLVLQATTDNLGQAPAVLNIGFDLRALPPLWTSIDALNHILSNRVLSAFEPSALAASLTNAICNQRHATERRNELIERFPGYAEAEKVSRYFGLTLPSGHIDQSYPDLIQGLVFYTDDCIYFSTLLADVLTEHGRHLAFGLGVSAPDVKQADFSSVLRDGLMPSANQYADFERQYRPKKVEMVVTM